MNKHCLCWRIKTIRPNQSSMMNVKAVSYSNFCLCLVFKGLLHTKDIKHFYLLSRVQNESRERLCFPLFLLCNEQKSEGLSLIMHIVYQIKEFPSLTNASHQTVHRFQESSMQTQQSSRRLKSLNE